MEQFVDSKAFESKIRTRLADVQDRIWQSAQGAGRDPQDVRLVVVTKAHPVEVLRAAIEAGAQHVGENYTQEAVDKKLALKHSGFDTSGVEWHMIGHIQSRKARLVSEHFDLVHSVDRLKIARRLNQYSGEAGRVLPVLLQVNVSGEQSKSGWPAWKESQWASLGTQVSQILEFPHLEVRGLMTIPPFFPEPEDARPFFHCLRQLRDYLAIQFPRANWHELSMGMSADFELAIEEGATLVRIGTAILGPRS